jgi:hypothetical protein
MSKKNLVVLALIIALIPTSAFAATITESVMNIDPNFINLLKLLFVVGSIAAIADSYIKDALVGKLNAQIKFLKETAALNSEAHKETREDARVAWEEVEMLLQRNKKLQGRIDTLNKDVDDLIEEVLSNAAAFHKERTKLQGDVQWNADQAQSLANTANNNAKLANEYMQKLQDLNQI